MKIGILKKESLKFLTVTTWPPDIRKNLVEKTDGWWNFSSDLLVKVNREIIMASAKSSKNLSIYGT